MFKRRVEESGKSTVLGFGFRIFYAHVANVLIMLVVAMLVENLSLIKIEASDRTSSICVTIVCFVFYVVYVYVHSWRFGQRDYNQVLYKHSAYQPLKPLYAALVSQSVGLVLAVLVQFPSMELTWVRYARYYYLNFNYFLITTGETFQAIYFVPVLFAPIIAPIAYHMGYRGVYLADKLVFKKPQNIKDDHR